MFDGIAPRYDLLNRLISFGLDRSWRRALVSSLGGASRVLDVATGTGDVALEIVRTHPESRVVGLDPSPGMLAVARRKVAAHGERIRLVEGDATALPFADGAFDASCIAFGIRNVPDRDAGLREMARVTRPGGVVAVLELGEPREGPLAPFARLHVHHVVPRVGAWLSGSGEYRYLQSSVGAFPPAEAFGRQMSQAGLEAVDVRRLHFGAAHLYLGTAPGC